MFMLISPRKMTRGQRARMILRKAGGLLLKSQSWLLLTPTKQHCVLVREERKQTLKEFFMKLPLFEYQREERILFLFGVASWKMTQNMKKAILCPNLSLGQKNLTFGSRSHWSLMVSKNLYLQNTYTGLAANDNSRARKERSL